MKRLVKTFGEATVLTTNKAPALLCASNKLRENGFYKTYNSLYNQTFK
ncbi:Transposase for insertion sequence element IS257 in transposon Tn4003 [Bacillus mycoides]|nr:Transposase for insertion sequence element IS257 in transposon Tn4003 [Bacillus mycoides]EEL02842.1 Transposase [Bacillus cereus BDRD-ST196]